jgi:hypothetical protein
MSLAVAGNFTNENGQEIKLPCEDLCDLRAAVSVA